MLATSNGYRTPQMLAVMSSIVPGSQDETAGCQQCEATVADDGKLTLQMRMPDCLATPHAEYLIIRHVAGLPTDTSRCWQPCTAMPTALNIGVRTTSRRRAISSMLWPAHRLPIQAGWQGLAAVRHSLEWLEVEITTDRRRGAIGVDLNADHLAVVDTDASGNYVNAWRVPLVTYGKSQSQAEALIGDAVASVVQYAREVGKPIVIEKLDFRQKKAALEGESRRYSRMLSSFAYGKIKAYFISRGYRQGVEIYQVYPNQQFSHRPGEVHGAIPVDWYTRQQLWCWPDAYSAALSASRVDGFVLSAMVSRSHSPYPCGNE